MAESKSLLKHTTVSIPLEAAWNAWTTSEGVTGFLAPKANVEARQGGLYELYFDLKAPKGFQGTEGCRVLTLDLQKRLGFEFLAPARFPNARRVRTRVDVLFKEVLKGGLVRVDLVHSGLNEGEEWDECYEFFGWSWDLALGRFQYRSSHGPVDWSHPYLPQGVSSEPPRKLGT